MNAYFPLLLSLLMATSLHAGRKTGFKIEIIEGRHWLVKPNGQPFFAHGITHASNRDAALNYQKFSEACKAVGFNAYGYGCPKPLRKDMPFVESWNHLVPISYYREKMEFDSWTPSIPKCRKSSKPG